MSHHHNPHTIDSVIKELMAGNDRFVSGKPSHPREDAANLDHLSKDGQTPMAAVLACSDSRAPVELLFDQGFGDIFVVRAAGQVAGVDQIGSLEYAVAHLGVPLVLVLGHSKCGAVTAALCKAQESGALGQLLSHLACLADDEEICSLPEPEKLNKAVTKNVELILNELRQLSPVLAQAEKSGQIALKGAVYDLDSHKVNWL